MQAVGGSAAHLALCLNGHDFSPLQPASHLCQWDLWRLTSGTLITAKGSKHMEGLVRRTAFATTLG